VSIVTLDLVTIVMGLKGDVARSRRQSRSGISCRLRWILRRSACSHWRYLITDIEMPELSGLDAASQLKGQAATRVIDPKLAAESWGDPDPLTDRQREVLRLTTDGMATADIATRLGLSAGTVRNYLSEAIAKLGAANRIEAAKIAKTKGWL
jgi:DNA-binding NarL/FixJ family response regulator